MKNQRGIPPVSVFCINFSFCLVFISSPYPPSSLFFHFLLPPLVQIFPPISFCPDVGKLETALLKAIWAAVMGAGGREMSILLDGVRDKNLMQLKKLNTALFPVRYNDKFYADTLASGEFTKLAYYSDICIGSIACRLEKKECGAVRVYIMTLGVLAPYRGLGIGTKLLNHVLDLCFKQNIGEIYLHVQTNNEDAIKFYKKFEFEITDTIHNYYTNITPPDCYVVTKFLNQSQTKQ